MQLSICAVLVVLICVRGGRCVNSHAIGKLPPCENPCPEYGDLLKPINARYKPDDEVDWEDETQRSICLQVWVECWEDREGWG